MFSPGYFVGPSYATDIPGSVLFFFGLNIIILNPAIPIFTCVPVTAWLFSNNVMSHIIAFNYIWLHLMSVAFVVAAGAGQFYQLRFVAVHCPDN